MKTEAIANRLEQVKGFSFGSGAMEDFKNVSDSDLRDRKTQLEKTIEKEGNFVFANDGRYDLLVKDILFDAEGDLVTCYHFELIKLRDLVSRVTGERIFKDGFQTEAYRCSLSNLKFVESIFNTFNGFKKHLENIEAELNYRIYGIKQISTKDIQKKKKGEDKKKSKKRINKTSLYKNYIQGTIRFRDEFKKLPNQKELVKFLGNYSESTLSRVMNNKQDLTSITLLMTGVQSGKETLNNYGVLDEYQNETLSMLMEEFVKNKLHLISRRK